MKKINRFRVVLPALAVLALTLSLTTTAFAGHSWDGYHWARTGSSFNLRLGDNVSKDWDKYLRTASNDWSKSAVLETSVVAGTTNFWCNPRQGRVEVCNGRYGDNGWLGVASIWANGQHITQATVRLNDTYYAMPAYNTPAWRQFVMCQEIGHTFGLAHQDENFDNANVGSCMDYTSNPESNQRPNAHDYQMLETIYNSHTDGSTTVQALPAHVAQAALDAPGQWGRLVHQAANGRQAVFERDFGNGYKVFTFVVWADPQAHEH